MNSLTTTNTSTSGSTGTSTNTFMSLKQGFGEPASPPSYSALCRAILRYRQKRVYALTFAGIAACLPLASFPVAGFDAAVALVYPTVWLYLAIAFVGTLAVFVARKQFLRTTAVPSTDRRSQYIALATTSEARLTLLAYGWAAACFTTAFVSILTKLSPAKSYLVVYKSPGRDVISLNERFVYIFLAVLSSVTSYAVHQLLRARQVLVFPKDDSPIPVRLQRKLSAKLATIPPLALSSNATLLGTYLLFKRTVLRFLIYRLPGGRMLRPFLLNMLRVNNISASLILSSLCISLASLAVLELANSLADVYYSQPISVSTYSTDPKRTLVHGLQSADPYIKRFAYLELRQIVAEDKARRIEIFSDIKTRTFEAVSKECLSQLEQSYGNLQRRGEPRQSAPSGTGSASLQSKPTSASRLPVTDENAFKPAPSTLADKLAIYAASPNGATQLVPTAAAASTSSALEKVPSIFQRKVQELAPPAVKEEAVKIKETVVSAEQNLLHKLERFTPTAIRESYAYKYLFDPLLSARFARCLPNADLDRCAAAALGSLLMASLQEDQYGVAQGDIGKILATLLAYLSALESFADELNALAEEGKFPRAAVKQRLEIDVQPLIDVLRENISGVTQTFRQFLGDLKLSPQVAKGVQAFL